MGTSKREGHRERRLFVLGCCRRKGKMDSVRKLSHVICVVICNDDGGA